MSCFCYNTKLTFAFFLNATKLFFHSQNWLSYENTLEPCWCIDLCFTCDLPVDHVRQTVGRCEHHLNNSHYVSHMSVISHCPSVCFTTYYSGLLNMCDLKTEMSQCAEWLVRYSGLFIVHPVAPIRPKAIAHIIYFPPDVTQCDQINPIILSAQIHPTTFDQMLDEACCLTWKMLSLTCQLIGYFFASDFKKYIFSCSVFCIVCLSPYALYRVLFENCLTQVNPWTVLLLDSFYLYHMWCIMDTFSLHNQWVPGWVVLIRVKLMSLTGGDRNYLQLFPSSMVFINEWVYVCSKT